MEPHHWKRIYDLLTQVDAEIEMLSDEYTALGGPAGSKTTDLVQQARGYALAASVK